MKQLKKVMYLLGMVVAICALVLVGTAIVQVGMVVIAEKMAIVIPDDNSIMVAISKLRTKLQDEQYQYIHTIRGLGYRMEARHEA